MLQAALLDCPFLDLFPFSENGFVAPEVDVGGCDVAQALVVTLMVVMIDEGFDLGFEIAGQEVVFQQDAVLQGLVPALRSCLGSADDTARRVSASCLCACSHSANSPET